MGTVTLPIGASNSGTNDWSDVHGEDQAIVDVLNGSVDANNLASNAVTTAKITDGNVTAVKLADAAKLGLDDGTSVRRGVTSIDTEETTTSTSYTTLTTPDRVSSVVLPTNGLLFVAYRALYKIVAGSNAASVAIFLGANQLKKFAADGVPVVAELGLNSAGDNYGLVNTMPAGASLVNTPSASSDSSLVTTGMTLGENNPSGPVAIEAAAGTYTVSIQWHVNAASGGTLSVKNRKLWVWTMGF